MPDVVTFGCRLNIVESEAMRKAADEAGLHDAVLINTCAVTGEAVRQARQAIRRVARERPGVRIVVAGCAAQTEPQTFADMPEVDLVLGNREKTRPASYRPEAFDLPRHERVRVADIFAVEETAGHLVEGFEGRTRAFLQVQNGCDHRCTFCVIPYGRGNSRSVPMGAVVDQARALVERGYAEIVLTGVDLTAYGADLPGTPRLGTLVRQVLRHVPELKRLRLSSIDSVEADADLMRALRDEERLMPHLHLSLQHGHDMILKRMKRRHSRADAVSFCEEARRLRPEIVFGADLIAGFPTETEEMAAENLSVLEACGITRLHVFPFSPRAGTPAARMPQLPRHVVKARAAALREVGEARLKAHMSGEIGRRRMVLAERGGRGRTEDFTPVRIEGVEAGTLLAATITGHDGRNLEASPA
ncbi:tRNA (N(6)-L-threonylcarbamoyladenosine(37)-C(2))-methylthiotransferase MtaB [Lutibaculum baratangense]|uniref:MiaB family protein, possibly involved in tRNA or rRNA modification n=1 Tax=Lutibaculum baratangense AMV1 TaxID=631454 RepID=V4RSF9_9HYPH|nr:tRNA (N(6)-L-threonylcarbamoyladenosine(37)-C(2))-methylthiotransferase MtaB [Lutibaculum baratangense]ESR26075.1 MiaB family protein, possibly involved in tRNA or rRNA modification [Lutibaculum baratangense AMV1]